MGLEFHEEGGGNLIEKKILERLVQACTDEWKEYRV